MAKPIKRSFPGTNNSICHVLPTSMRTSFGTGCRVTWPTSDFCLATQLMCGNTHSAHHSDKIQNDRFSRPFFPHKADGKIEGAVGDLAIDQTGRSAFSIAGRNQSHSKAGSSH